MSLSSPLLIVCFTPEAPPDIAGLAEALGYPHAQVAVGSVTEAIAALNARTQPPEYIVIDIGSHGSDILPSLDEFALHCEATVRVAVIGQINDITFYRELKARGIVEYFPQPVQGGDIRQVLMQASSRQQRGGSGGQGSVISCMSAASGDGASTLAVNLAYCMAETYKQPTVLVDMDYQFGLIARSLDVTAPFGIRELFDHPDRGLDTLLIDKMLVKYGERLNIVASPGELRFLPVIRPELISDLVGILRTKFRFVVIDVPHVWTDWTAALPAASDHSVMVAQLWLRSLTHATRLLAAWQSAGVERDKVSLIINRSGAKFKEAITAEDFERICHHKIVAHMHNDIKAVVHAENHGKTLFETGQGALIQQQIKQIAQMLMARCQGHAWHQEAAPAVAKKGLLSIFDKKAGS